MLTVGIDLASQDKNTAACEIDWDTREVRIHHPVTFGGMLALLGKPGFAAIDAPFGWPDAFRFAIDGWSESGRWTHGDQRDPLRFRETDLRLEGVPLSVTSDRIAITAMRCAQLLAAHVGDTPLDRVRGPVIEAYPAAAMRAWGFSIRGYRRSREMREDILARLAEGIGFPLPEVAVETDHALDALVCALVARAADQRATQMPAELTEQIRREGWIHVPTGSLAALR
jgi:hypothetical protein